MLNRIPHRLALAVLAMLLLASPAFSSTKPPELEGVITSSSPYGRGSLSWFLFHVYDAQIWTDATRWSYEAPFALCVTYAMGFDANELKENTLEQVRKVATLSPEEEKRFDGYLVRAYRDVQDNDRVCAMFTPPGQLAFFVNAEETLHVQDAGFARAFFDIWLSEKTPEPSLRSGLLGKNL